MRASGSSANELQTGGFFHVRIKPDDQRGFFGSRKWNIEEERLLSQFVEPYRTGQPITTDGEVIRTDKLQQMRIAWSPVQLAPPASASDDLEFFLRLEQVTDDYLEGPPGYAATGTSAEPAIAESDALDRVLRLCERFPRVARELDHRGRRKTPLTMDDEYDVQYVLRALLALEFDDVRQPESELEGARPGPVFPE
jgi:hypothetical protein